MSAGLHYENALLHPARLGCHFLLCICIFTIITGKITRQLAILTQPRCEFIGPLGRSLCRSLSLCVRRLAEKESHSGRSDFLVGVRQAVSGQSEFLAHNSGTGRVRFRDAHSGDTKIGDFYAACMDETGAEKRGLSTVQPELDSIAKLKSAKEIAALMSHLQLTYGASIVFNAGSSLDPDNSEQQIAQIDQGGLGLPDRDYYVKDDAKSKETRDRYVQHVQHIFELAGDSSEAAKANAETVMRLETLLAKASLTRVERRNPYNLKHKMKLAELNQLAPNFDWAAYSVRPNIHSSKSSTSAHPSSSKKPTLS